jgi:hypothetical protein
MGWHVILYIHFCAISCSMKLFYMLIWPLHKLSKLETLDETTRSWCGVKIKVAILDHTLSSSSSLSHMPVSAPPSLAHLWQRMPFKHFKHEVFYFIPLLIVLVFILCVYICLDMPCTYCGWIFFYIYIYTSFSSFWLVHKVILLPHLRSTSTYWCQEQKLHPKRGQILREACGCTYYKRNCVNILHTLPWVVRTMTYYGTSLFNQGMYV